MITPLMHILSCLDEEYKAGAPIGMLHLNRSDWDLIVTEAKRLGSLFSDETKIWITESPAGLSVVSEVQVIDGSPVNLNPYTALLLTRVYECFPLYLRELGKLSVDVVEDDLSADAVVLRLEGNPRYVYVYVYNTMELPSLSYEAKILKIQELLFTILRHSVVQSNNLINDASRNRLEMHSRFGYWKGMLMSDYVKHNGTVAPPFTLDTLETMRAELKNLGFYGFVNPLQMFMDFSGARVSRKVEVNISSEVIAFLMKVVASGGADIK